MDNNYEGEDKNSIMISSPRIVSFEFMVLDYAIELIKAYQETSFDGKFVEEDLQNLKSMEPSKEQTVLMFNIGQKKTCENAIKLLRGIKYILKAIDSEKEPFTSACFKRIPGLEDNDSETEIFERRMAMRFYFKELKMHYDRLQRISEALI